ncbi:MAG TPA: hypothetical protein VIX18_09315 [Nitrospirota bacterium]
MKKHEKMHGFEHGRHKGPHVGKMKVGKTMVATPSNVKALGSKGK